MLIIFLIIVLILLALFLRRIHAKNIEQISELNVVISGSGEIESDPGNDPSVARRIRRPLGSNPPHKFTPAQHRKIYDKINMLYASRLMGLRPVEKKLLDAVIEKPRLDYKYYYDYVREHNMRYRELYLFNPQLHKGQRKLLLNEIRFLVHSRCDPRRTILLYVGAASGQHLQILTILFPGIKMILYDKSPFHKNIIADGKYYSRESDLPLFKTETLPNYMIFNKYFDADIAKFYAGWNAVNIYQSATTGSASKDGNDIDLLFISDIRVAPEDGTIKSMVKNVAVDMVMQYDWVKIIKPKHSQLKFRLPYIIGFEDTKPENVPVPSNDKDGGDVLVPYFPGSLFLQPWAPVHSTETRLHVTRDDLSKPDVIYSSAEYENACFAFNLCRPLTAEFDPKFGIKSLDILLEEEIINEYLAYKMDRPPFTLQSIRGLIEKYIPYDFFQAYTEKIEDFTLYGRGGFNNRMSKIY